MFEMSLLESGGVLKTKSRWWAFAAFFINASFLLIMILIPVIHPEALPKQALSMLLVAPPPPPSAPAPMVKEAAAANTAKAPTEMIDRQLVAPPVIPSRIDMSKDSGAPRETGFTIPGGVPGGTNSEVAAIGSIFRDQTVTPAVIKQATHPDKPMVVSAGVAQGYLLNKTAPAYPPIARASRTQGTVVLAAVISKSGLIENLHVVSGPALLQQAALDAVKTWRYKPYLLNGDPVEVETQVNVIFNLGN